MRKRKALSPNKSYGAVLPSGSGTSIGANANEAAYGVSQADFISKMQIALKETAETEYWLKLLLLSDYLDEKLAQSLINDCLEIKRILIASLKTAKESK